MQLPEDERLQVGVQSFAKGVWMGVFYGMFAGDDCAFYPYAVVVLPAVAEHHDLFAEEAGAIGRVVMHCHIAGSSRAYRFVWMLGVHTPAAAMHSVYDYGFLAFVAE